MSECRLCLQIGPSIYIFDRLKSLPEKIWDCCGLTIAHNDGLPEQICCLCEIKLNSFIEFKQMCMKNCIILQERHKEITGDSEDSKISIDIYDRNDMPCSPGVDEKFTREDVKPFQILKTACLLKDSENDSTSDVTQKKEGFYSEISPITKIIKIENNISTLNDRISEENSVDRLNSPDLCRNVNDKYIVDDLKVSQESNIGWIDYLSKGLPDKSLISIECSSEQRNNFGTINKRLLHLHSNIEYLNINKKQCTICHRSFKTEKMRDNHVKRIHEEKWKLFECDLCHKSFDRKSNIYLHIKRHIYHPANLRYGNCNICNAVCGSEISFDKHMKRYHETKLKTFECDVCHKIFKCRDTIRQHLKRHMNMVEKKHVCDKCDYITEYKSELIRHVNSTHLNKTFACDVCHKIFTRACRMRLHRKRHMNTLEKKHRCDKCDYKTEVKGALIRHIETVHSNKTFECYICRKIFKSKYIMMLHTKRHMNQLEKKYQCDKCDYKADAKWILIRHIESVHLRKMFECDICHKNFTRNYIMKRHRKRHLLEIEVLM